LRLIISWFRTISIYYRLPDGLDFLHVNKTRPSTCYLRFIGDRSIQEKDFGRIQIDRVLEMQKWADNIKNIQDERVNLAIIAANNHYAGFGPGTANIFRNMVGLPDAKWKEKADEVQEQLE
jgi:hypothetical protein